MDWLKHHLGSLGYAADFYIPNTGGVGNGTGHKKIAGQEQIKNNDTKRPPRVVKTDKYDYPRIQKFFNWDQFLDYIDWRGHEGRRSSHTSTSERYQHTLTHSFQEAMNLARYGWPEGLRKIQNANTINTPIQQIIQQTYNLNTKYDITGGSVNIGRYIMGMPDCMRRITSTQDHALPARIQKVIIIGTFDKKTDTDTVLSHGFKIYQIINALEQANIQTEITIAFHTNRYCMYYERDYYFYETYIKFKESTDIMYPEKLLFCLAHPSMLRRLVFSEWERNPMNIRNTFHFYDSDNGGYGKCIAEWMPPAPMIKDTLIIPDISKSWKMHELIDQVNAMIKRQYEQTR